MVKRVSDVFLCLIAAVLLFTPMLIIAVLIKATSPGPVLFWSDRVGRGNKIFRMPKFRTMHTSAPLVATHEFLDPVAFITTIGRFLRRTSIDELPQLWSIFIGDMSLVGPRPALSSQFELIALRTERNVHSLRPGLTGLAQVRGRDEISIADKVKFDEEYLKNHSLLLDFKIILATVQKVAVAKGVSH